MSALSSQVSGEMVEAGVPRRAGAPRRVFTPLAGHLGPKPLMFIRDASL
jgi:hypothetical protein